ncbi:MAG: hypothetical protein WBF07_10910, partial [Xanthobacteraceae bacterium]
AKTIDGPPGVARPHGLQKWFGVPIANPAYANLQMFTIHGIAGVNEGVCSALAEPMPPRLWLPLPVEP